MHISSYCVIFSCCLVRSLKFSSLTFHRRNIRESLTTPGKIYDMASRRNMINTASDINPEPIRLVLGSGSSSRKSILLEAGYTDINIYKPDIDEKAIGDRSIGTFENAKSIVLNLGNAKADNILRKKNSINLLKKFVIL